MFGWYSSGNSDEARLVSARVYQYAAITFYQLQNPSPRLHDKRYV